MVNPTANEPAKSEDSRIELPKNSEPTKRSRLKPNTLGMVRLKYCFILPTSCWNRLSKDTRLQGLKIELAQYLGRDLGSRSNFPFANDETGCFMFAEQINNAT